MNRIAIASVGALGVAVVLTGAVLFSTGAGNAAGATTPPTGVAAVPKPPTPEEAFKTECGACHMAYPPGLLPVRSWLAIMGDLGNHFGENASLDEATATAIADYLFANAADTSGTGSGILRGLKASDVPLRITDTPWWQRQHTEVPDSAFARANVKSKSNCLACHGDGSGDN